MPALIAQSAPWGSKAYRILTCSLIWALMQAEIIEGAVSNFTGTQTFYTNVDASSKKNEQGVCVYILV